MPEPSFAFQIAEITEILHRLFHLKHRLKVVLPEDLARLKAQLIASHPGGKAGSAADYDLFYSIGMILSRQQEPITMGDLSRALDVPLSSATRIVDWLVKNGYAERQPDPDDRRIVRVALTATGLEMNGAINAFIRDRIERWLRRFTPKECAVLVPLMRKFVDVLEEEE